MRKLRRHKEDTQSDGVAFLAPLFIFLKITPADSRKVVISSPAMHSGNMPLGRAQLTRLTTTASPLRKIHFFEILVTSVAKCCQEAYHFPVMHSAKLDLPVNNDALILAYAVS